MPSPHSITNPPLPLIPSDLVDAFVTFIGPEILSHPINYDPATLHALKDTAKAVGTACMRSLKFPNNPDLNDIAVAVTRQQWRDVKVLLVTLCRLARDGSATVEIVKEFQIIGILAMFSNPTNGLPFPVPEVAKRLKEIFLLVMQGKPAVVMNSGDLTLGTTGTAVKSESDEVLVVKKEDSDDDSVKSEPDSDDDVLIISAQDEDMPIVLAEDEVLPDTQQNTIPTSNKQEEIPWKRAPSHHPIFGVQGIMHHILLRRDKTKSYKIDPEYTSTSGAVIGHNGFEVGAWFPRQLAMVRDGIHNLPVGGISGSLAVGAYSVVLSNPSIKPANSSPPPISHTSGSSNTASAKYPATDIDLGSIIYYSSTVKPLLPKPQSITSTTSKGTTSSGSSPNTNKGSLILAKSIATGNPIRVIRKWTCDFEDRPCVGYRYEGLYRAVGMEKKVVRFEKGFSSGGELIKGERGGMGERKKNDGNKDRSEDGGGYFWTIFKLERCPDQKDIDTSRPTEDEKMDYARVELGF
ncbi:hypothetical protein BKA64DRAFT_714003 [Cadophora sp. MPI-SDFR-AT-0126]|nr:hypothetical protein BKA64DRAFT_714003 [Leotiomycetes sp. MPI-SDFR-AT-0126]